MKKAFFILFAFSTLLLGANLPPYFQTEGKMPPLKLSEYKAFAGPIAELNPAPGVIPYNLNTPLFSDYAEKSRFVMLPPGAKATYNEMYVFDFPVGTKIFKTFWYYKDKRKPEKGRFLIETRVLIHEENGWATWPYIWDEKQTEATLEVAGGRRDIQWVDEDGKKQKLNYVVPNQNQCKSCHKQYEEIGPIGPAARQLNGDLAYSQAGKTHNQLEYWQEAGILADFPGLDQAPKAPVWNDPASGSLEDRARIYLDINCGHCHNPKGPANTSGMYLDIHQTDLSFLGLGKPPIAAGRGSGGRQYGIVAGDAENSILPFRMASTDPGIMMPELGRKMTHIEGVALIREWIDGMK
ncbi:MAG: hypothetical protein H6581_07670 [Bacteroidia bacterium]|nr:hypothetical protein [Bacteroidia bacterium]